mmetsp:Transcript_103278/g.296475  ORF Transcript_103278/g.296475 Transcript_103278/m.296475 type:complete len:489 (-) Transcript_103278:30-1496(-)
MVLRRLITSQRLDDGLVSSAKGVEPCCMCFGAVVAVSALRYMYFNESVYFAETVELERVQAEVYEQECSGQGAEGEIPSGSVVHLLNCPVTGRLSFSAEDRGLEFLQDFEENMPKGSFGTGAYFQVHIQQFSRRRSSQWRDIVGAGSLTAGFTIAHDVHIGVFSASEEVVEVFPNSRVQLHPSSQYKQEAAMFSSAQAPYTSKNMQVWDNVLYTSDPKSPYDDDIKLWFTVADAKSVSALTTESSDELFTWRIDKQDVNLTSVEAGAVTTKTMIEAVQQQFFLKAREGRVIGILTFWLATFLLVFPAYACHIMDKDTKDAAGDCGAICRALPLSMVPSTVIIAMSWSFLRAPSQTLAVGAILMTICTVLAFAPGMRSARPQLASLVGPPSAVLAQQGPVEEGLGELERPLLLPSEAEDEMPCARPQLPADGSPPLVQAEEAPPMSGQAAEAEPANRGCHPTLHLISTGMAVGFAVSVLGGIVLAVTSD